MRFQTATISRYLGRALLLRLRSWSSPSGLFYPVCLAFAGGLLAAVDAGPEAPGFALDSVWLYRAEVGLAFMSAIYMAGMTLWLAWHGRGFFELAAFGVTLKASEAKQMEAAGTNVYVLAEELASSLAEMTVVLTELDERMTTLEEQTS